MLNILILTPIIGIITLSIIKKNYKEIGLLISIINFIFSLITWICFDYNIIEFQFIYEFIDEIYLGIDGISLLLINITNWIIPICILASYNSIKKNKKLFIILLLILESILIITFLLLNTLYFYIAFEFSLIPMFILIGLYGNRNRKIYASYQFFLMTLFGSYFMLLSILIIQDYCGSLNYIYLTSYINLINSSNNILHLLWIGFFISFAIKTPMIPFHLWLSDAHTEANVSGSILLAGILLKLAGYGFIRYSIYLFYKSSFYFSPFIQFFTTISVLYSSFTTLRQIDLKKIIAYSSIGHMNLTIFSLFSNNFQGINGSLFYFIAHAFVSPALFFSISILYDRFHSRLFKYFKGITIFMPLFSLFFFLFNLANMGTPLTSNFVGEFLSFIGIFHFNPFFFFFIGFSIILSASYSIWLFNRISFGSFSYYIKPIFDINRREFSISFTFLFFIFFFGLFPNILLNVLSLSSSNILYSFLFIFPKLNFNNKFLLKKNFSSSKINNSDNNNDNNDDINKLIERINNLKNLDPNNINEFQNELKNEISSFEEAFPDCKDKLELYHTLTKYIKNISNEEANIINESFNKKGIIETLNNLNKENKLSDNLFTSNENIDASSKFKDIYHNIDKIKTEINKLQDNNNSIDDRLNNIENLNEKFNEGIKHLEKIAQFIYDNQNNINILTNTISYISPILAYTSLLKLHGKYMLKPLNKSEPNLYNSHIKENRYHLIRFNRLAIPVLAFIYVSINFDTILKTYKNIMNNDNNLNSIIFINKLNKNNKYFSTSNFNNQLPNMPNNNDPKISKNVWFILIFLPVFFNLILPYIKNHYPTLYYYIMLILNIKLLSTLLIFWILGWTILYIIEYYLLLMFSKDQNFIILSENWPKFIKNWIYYLKELVKDPDGKYWFLDSTKRHAILYTIIFIIYIVWYIWYHYIYII